MVAGRERQHSNRVPRIDRYQSRILPVAAIFGGNASGKTNFFRALNFARRLIVVGTRNPGNPIPLEPFKLDQGSASRPSRFAFELLIDDGLYDYSFSVTRESVIEEKLVKRTQRAERSLYERNGQVIQFHQSLPDRNRLHFAFESTRENQLFLTNSVLLNIETFANIFKWFDEQLELIAPDSRFASFEYWNEDVSQHHARMKDVLEQLDLGVSRLDTEEVSLTRILPKELIDNLKENLPDNQLALIGIDSIGNRHIVIRRNGNLVAKKLVTFHRGIDGAEVKFEFLDESDGSQRMIDLLPAFLDLTSAKCQKVYVIDEFDRSLHTHLTRWLLEHYLLQCSRQSRSQLLFTTHDAQLIDQSLLRRDEIWITETNRHGSSHLISFGEYQDIRHDKDIRKSYLQGRLGGVPKIFI